MRQVAKPAFALPGAFISADLLQLFCSFWGEIGGFFLEIDCLQGMFMDS